MNNVNRKCVFFIFNKNDMKQIIQTIFENDSAKSLKPIFYFTNMDFFDTITNPSERKFITASYKNVGKNRYVYFYYKNKQIGFLKLLCIDPVSLL